MDITEYNARQTGYPSHYTRFKVTCSCGYVAPDTVLQANASSARPSGKRPSQCHLKNYQAKLTIAILIEKGEGLLEFGNLFFGKLISHGYLFQCSKSVYAKGVVDEDGLWLWVDRGDLRVATSRARPNAVDFEAVTAAVE